MRWQLCAPGGRETGTASTERPRDRPSDRAIERSTERLSDGVALDRRQGEGDGGGQNHHVLSLAGVGVSRIGFKVKIGLEKMALEKIGLRVPTLNRYLKQRSLLY